MDESVLSSAYGAQLVQQALTVGSTNEWKMTRCRNCGSLQSTKIQTTSILCGQDIAVYGVTTKTSYGINPIDHYIGGMGMKLVLNSSNTIGTVELNEEPNYGSDEEEEDIEIDAGIGSGDDDVYEDIEGNDPLFLEEAIPEY